MNHRRSIALLVLFAAVLLGAFAAPGLRAQEWKTYSYPAEGFSAAFPAEPDLTEKDLDLKDAKLKVHSYATQDGDTALLVGVWKYSKPSSTADPDAVLDAATDGAVASTNSHLIGEKKIALGLNHGVEFETENESIHMTARFYYAGGTIYQTMVVGPVKRRYPATARFLDSFQLVSKSGR
ncbi:MAG: hypothetical protein WCE75_17475 [Terracidiphilus sp.]